MADAASSRMLKLARSRKSLIRIYCRYCGARIEINVVLDIQYPIQELSVLAIPLEPLAHVKLVRSQLVVKDRHNYEKSNWVVSHAGGSIGSGTSSEGIVLSSTTKSFLIRVLNEGNVYHREFDILRWHAQTVLLPHDFFLVRVFSKNRRVHHNYQVVLSFDL